MQEYLIGIDAGGTKTLAVAYDMTGRALSRVTEGAANLSADFDGGVQAILATVRRLTATVPGRALGVCIGCAGAETGDRKERLTALLARETALPYIHVTNDAVPALYAAHGEGDGVLLIAGTGSVAFARIGGKIRRAGGWGHLIGDDGSGWRIAMDAIRSITDGLDRAAGPGMLQKEIFRAIGAQEAPALLEFVYSASKREVAALAPTVADCARAGDAAATAILVKAGQALAALVTTLCPPDRTAPLPVATAGGVVTHITEVREAFSAVLEASGRPIKLLQTTPDPTFGGYVLLRSLYPALRERGTV